MPLVRFEVRNEFGLGDPELYRAASKKEDPKALLDGVAVAGLVGILRQLGDLAEFAADIFHDLHEQVTATSARGRKMLTRIQHIEAAIPSLEKAIQNQRSHIHFAYVAGSEWHADTRTTQSHLLSSDLPRFMMDTYEECRGPPRLYMLDKFDSAGTGACLMRYSDPSYFKRVWTKSELEKAEKVQKEKKARKIKRKGSQLKNGEIQHATSLSPCDSSTRFASPSSDERSFSNEAASVSGLRPKPELASISASFGLRSRLNYVEQVPDTSSSVGPDEPECDRLSVSKLHTNQPGDCASDEHDELDGCGTDASSLHDSLQKKSVCRSPSVTWDEKTEIIKPTSPNFSDGIVMDGDQDADTVAVSSEPLNVANESPKLGTLGQGDSMLDTSNFRVPLYGENHFDEIASETENYMDALNTLESETETDSECQTKREVKALHNLRCQEMESESAKLQGMVAPSSDCSGAEISTSSHNSLNEDVSTNNSNLVSPESLEDLQSHKIVGFATEPDHSVDNEICEHNAPDVVRMSSTEGVESNQHLESSIRDLLTTSGDVCTANTSDSQVSSPVDIPGVPSTTLWTNGNLLGLEPSKPPDFSVSYISNGDIASGLKNTGGNHSSYMVSTRVHSSGLATKPETATLQDEITPKYSKSVEKMDGSPHGSSSEFEKIQDARSNNINAHSDRPAMMLTKGTELPGVHNAESQPAESDQNTRDIPSSFSAIAQRFLPNSIQRKAPVVHVDISNPSGMGNDDDVSSQPVDTPLLNKNKEGPTGVVSQQSYEKSIKGNVNRGSSKDSISSCPNYSGHSSPPLEHMKISFHPMNGLEPSKLKLEFCNDNVHDSIDELMFPSFQLLPGHILPPQDSGSESDDDTFCRSCPYTSEDHLSPRSDSNSELWEQEDRIGSNSHEISDDSCRVSSSPASVSSFKGFDQMNQLDQAIGHHNLEVENGISYFQSGNVANLPGLQAFTTSKSQRGQCDSLTMPLEDSAPQTPNELPPPPPLPPMQWRMMKHFSVTVEQDSDNAEIVEDCNVLQAQRSTAQNQQAQNIPRPPPFPETLQVKQKLNEHKAPNDDVGGMIMDKGEQMLLQIRNKHDRENLNGQREPKNDEANDQELDEREELLHQIRNKTFNLRRTATAKPSLALQPSTNSNVSAILEKANAIRQAFVGSDDGGDNDNWSDG